MNKSISPQSKIFRGISKSKKSWFVLYCKPRSEKKLATLLEQAGYTCYCPTRTEVRQWSDRKKKVQVPVLPSMVLVYLENGNRNDVFQFPQAVRFLFWQGKPAVIRQVEVDSLEASLQREGMVVEGVESLSPGQKLDMTTLGFQKIEGTVQYVSENKVWVLLKELGYVVKLVRS